MQEALCKCLEQGWLVLFSVPNNENRVNTTIHFCRKLCANARRADGVVQPVPAGASHKASARNDKWSHLSVWIKNGNMAFFALLFGDKRRHWHYAIRLLVRNKTYFFRQNEKEANFLSELNTMLRVIRMLDSFQNIPHEKEIKNESLLSDFFFSVAFNVVVAWTRDGRASGPTPSDSSRPGPSHHHIHIIIRRGTNSPTYPHPHPTYPVIIRRGTNSSNGAALAASRGVSPGWACQLQRGRSWPSFVICISNSKL